MGHLNPGDLVRLKNTSSYDQHYKPGDFFAPPSDGVYDGIKAVVLKGPYNKPEYGEIPIYRVRTDDPKLGNDQFEAECTWSALEKFGEGGDVEFFEKVKEWEKHLNG